MSGNDEPSQLPHPKDDDAEDVAWALSTAEALWKRGERADAISWIRKAAAAAAEAELDLRVLELAKAAAELSAAMTDEAARTAQVAIDEVAPASEVRDSAIEIELEAATAPGKAPPRKPPPKHAPSPPVPTPNPFPSPLRSVSLQDIALEDYPPEDDELNHAPIAAREAEHHESQPKIPTVPPPPPDRAPSQAEMRAVVPPVPRPAEPRVSTIKSHAPPPLETTPAAPSVLDSARPRTTRPRPLSLRPAAPPSQPLHLDDLPEAPPQRLQTPRPPRPLSRPAPALAASSELRLKVPLAPPVPIIGVPISSAEVDQIEALEDIPDDARSSLIDAARAISLAADETMPAPAAVMVLVGDVEVRSARHAVRIDLIEPGQMRLLAPVPPAQSELIIAGGAGGARVLAITHDRIERLRKVAPWVVQELEPASDDVHVVAGALRGKLGVRLDGEVLDEILDCTDVVRLQPSVVVVKRGEPVRAFIVVGAGELALRTGEGPDGRVVAGEVLFPRELLEGSAAPAQVRAGPAGALLLVANRASTTDLLARAASLVEILREG
jgi:hypothetical protein